MRGHYEHSLVLDAGDTFQGTLWFQHYKGLEAKHFMSELGYDVMVRDEIITYYVNEINIINHYELQIKFDELIFTIQLMWSI